MVLYFSCNQPITDLPVIQDSMLEKFKTRQFLKQRKLFANGKSDLNQFLVVTSIELRLILFLCTLIDGFYTSWSMITLDLMDEREYNYCLRHKYINARVLTYIMCNIKQIFRPLACLYNIVIILRKLRLLNVKLYTSNVAFCERIVTLRFPICSSRTLPYLRKQLEPALHSLFYIYKI